MHTPTQRNLQKHIEKNEKNHIKFDSHHLHGILHRVDRGQGSSRGKGIHREGMSYPIRQRCQDRQRSLQQGQPHIHLLCHPSWQDRQSSADQSQPKEVA